MVQAEAYGLWNGALCVVSLMLGGKLAGLSSPGKGKLVFCGVLSSLGGIVQLYQPSMGLAVFFLCPLSVWICYGGAGLTAFARALVTTVCAALLPGGGALLLMSLGQSPALALSLSALLALLLWTLCTLLPTVLQRVQQVEIWHGGRSVILPAMLDSGNLLRDPLTSSPVLVISKRAALTLFPEYPLLCSLEDLPPGFRLLSVRTAAGRGLWPLFRPEGCRVYMDGQAVMVQPMVAVAGQAYEGVQALVPAAMLPGQWAPQAGNAVSPRAAFSLMSQKEG